jgi:hypothetical protein
MGVEDPGDVRRDVIERAIGEASLDPGEMLTGWVLIFELANLEDNAQYLGVCFDSSNTVWKAGGMLDYALRNNLLRPGSGD